ncbi:MAG TPA: rhodanese-like domain-containing protein [Burkholderiaceae bacterium]|nr:rhodanese-like domain-containing protein [Burkholderiaceae bacterium]
MNPTQRHSSGTRAAASSRRAPWCLLGLAGLLVAGAAGAEPVSAAKARSVLSEGAIAWDVRDVSSHATGLLPGAVAAPADRLDLASLQATVSRYGIDLSRGVVLYGQPGDPVTQRLYSRLRELSPGPVYWLVGGAQEWRLAGLPLARDALMRAPVPQHLVQREAGEEAPRMAADALRRPHPISSPQLAGTAY